MHNTDRRLRLLSILTRICVSVLPCTLAQAGPATAPAARDSISVSADTASEDRDSRALRMEGNVRVGGGDWEFTAERATISGSLEHAEHLRAEGAPARIFFRNAGGEAGVNEVEGLARVISYRRHEDILQLNGGASLRRDANTLTSDDIEYRRANDLFKAGGAGGVRLTITPGQRHSADSPPQR